VKYDLLFRKYCDTTSTWVYKYSKIFGNRNVKGKNKRTKIRNTKHEESEKKTREIQKEKEIKREIKRNR